MKPITPPNTDDMLEVFTVISRFALVYRHNDKPLDTSLRENDAEHSYALATLGCAMAERLNTHLASPLDAGKIAQFGLVHDLTEIYMEHGDISVYADQSLLASKKTEEAVALHVLAEKTAVFPWITRTIEEYENQSSPEARFVYALDKLVVYMVVLKNDRHHAAPTMERYQETETTARAKIQASFPELLPYFEDLCLKIRDSPHFFTTT